MNINYTEVALGSEFRLRIQVLFDRYRRPVFCGPENGDDFEVNQVVPATDPFVQRIKTGRLHDLETAGACRVHPTGLIHDTPRQHAAVPPEPFPNGLGVAAFEAFDDHEKHDWQCTRFGATIGGLQFATLR